MKMKYIYILTISAFITSCSSMQPIDQNLSANNLALVKNTVFDPLFSIKSKSTTLKAIDGKAINDETNHEISAGKHTFTASCEYYETSTYVLTGTHTFEVALEKGHIYQLTPVPATHKKTNKATCVILLKNLTIQGAQVGHIDPLFYI